MLHLMSRRTLLKGTIITAVGAASLPKKLHSMPVYDGLLSDPWNGFKAGIASYTFRKLSVADTIRAMQRLQLNFISLKDFHLPMKTSTDERKQVIDQFRSAGITALSCGNITMENDEENIRHAFEYAKDAGIPTIVCSPHPGSMAILDRMVKTYDIRLAIHNHGPEDKRFPSPYDVWNAVKPYDARIGLCIDVGHTARAKVDPAEAILKCRDRLYDLHFKDINSTAPDGHTVPAGRGVLDLRSIVRALQKIRYDRLFSIEYESSPDDPLPDVSETMGFAKGLLAGLR